MFIILFHIKILYSLIIVYSTVKEISELVKYILIINRFKKNNWYLLNKLSLVIVFIMIIAKLK